MNPIAVWLLTALLWLAGPAHAENKPAGPAGFYVANWNVENLFDTLDDPNNPADNEFLPNNPTTRWTRVRFETKLDNLARVISGLNRGQGPDLLGLQEIENEDVVHQLSQKIQGKSYGVVYAESDDPRGIDTALLYNRDLFALSGSRAYPVPLKWGRTTRDILHAELLDPSGHRLHVLVNHWPSRGGGIEESEPNRFAAARTLSAAVDQIFRRDPAAHVVVMGDFNDEPASRSIRVVLGVEPYPSRSGYVPNRLYNLASRQSAKGWGSFFHSYRGDVQWRMYDQIMVSGALLQRAQVEQDTVSFWIDKPDYMLKEKGKDKGSPVPTFENQEAYRGGFSDHFPVGARFIYRAP